MAENLEEYLLTTRPPRRLRWALLQDSPTGATLRKLLIFELFCLGVAPLPFLLPRPVLTWLADFLTFFDPPGIWLGLWLLACGLALVYSRHLRKSFNLAEQGLATRGRVISVERQEYTQWVYYSAVPLERWTFTVSFPEGPTLSFRSEGHSPQSRMARVGKGDQVTALYRPGNFAASCRLLGLEGLESRSNLLLDVSGEFPHWGWLVLFAALAALAWILYTATFCPVLDSSWDHLKLPLVAGAILGVVGGQWSRRRGHTTSSRWVLVALGLILGPILLLGAGWMTNCWLDFHEPRWVEGRVQGRTTRNLSHQVPIPVGRLKIWMAGELVEYSCRASRVATFPTEVLVRINQGALGYRWIGEAHS